MWRRYLLWFAQEHVDFRHAEMQSILDVLKIPIKYIEQPCIMKPYWIVELPSEECARRIASRSVLLKNCIELWSRAKTESQLYRNLADSMNNSTGKWIENKNLNDSALSDHHICPNELIQFCSANKSFKVEVETFCKHFSMKEKVGKIEKFAFLPLEGPIKLNNPDIKLSYIEFYGMDPNDVPDEPWDVFFGKWIADGQRDLIQRHTLKKRQFIGNTSMDAQLALLMANQAQVRNGDVIIDPFVGSGSLFVAASHFGAYVWGSDIDFMMLHGRTRPTRVGQKVREKESIRSNMKSYGSESKYLDVVVSDFSLPLWRAGLKFDAIITDPPYGVREPAEKIGIQRENYTLTDQHLINHVPAKVEYGLPHIYGDLLTFAATHLEMGRRLVCWYPLVREGYSESQLPTHPCMSLVGNSEQVLSRLTARRLLTYQKTSEPEPHTAVDSNSEVYNFREKYFSLGNGQMTRKEIKKKRAEELASYIASRQQARIKIT